MRYALIGLLAVLFIPTFAQAGDRHRGGGSGFSISIGVRDSWGSRRDGGYVDTSFRYSNRNYNYNHDRNYNRPIDRNYNTYDRGGRYDHSFRGSFYRPAPVIIRPAPVYCPPPVYYYSPSPRYYSSYRYGSWCR